MKKPVSFYIMFLLTLLLSSKVHAEDGYRLWLRYDLIQNQQLLQEYRLAIYDVLIDSTSPTRQAAKNELQRGLTGLLGKKIPFTNNVISSGTLIVGTVKSSPVIASLNLGDALKQADDQGYVIQTISIDRKKCIVIAANTDTGTLYGVFGFLRFLQTHKAINNLSIISSPKITYRILDHWDNLDRTVERGYAGFSLWHWNSLPEYKYPRYTDYARANASIGINGTVLNNVNTTPTILTKNYLVKVAALADVFRPYGIKVYLSINFSSPMLIGGLKTADPMNPKVREWWKKKADEIYHYIPDFGGFLVKANSEGQPGPNDYGRTHAQGANMLAEALAPHGGIVMWRAFVYSRNPQDRTKEAYDEFKPLDGKFDDNVLIQSKNGPLDFQPREPFNPLFGSMPHTHIMMELQITQEYLGHSTSLVYLAPLYKEVLESDTYAKGKGSTVAKVIDGSLYNQKISGIAGVANTGDDRNWTGHPFGQANWYAFGRLAWNHELSASEIAEEWIRMTFSNDAKVINPVKKMMMASREIAVDYQMPLGLHHIMAWNTHYGPGPWVHEGRPDWTAVYYHRADSAGIGFDRTPGGSNAVSQYHEPLSQKFADLNTCPQKYLLWFHHLSWNYKLKSGRTLWDGLVHHYYAGVDSVRWMLRTWNSLDGLIDNQRFKHVQALLRIQEKLARWWRDGCVLYFQTYSHMPIPPQYAKPEKSLEFYEKLKDPHAIDLTND